MVVFTLVFLGCPRKVLFSHWFYKVVREKCCFHIGFTMVVREKPSKTLLKSSLFVDNPPGMVWTPERSNKYPSQPPQLHDRIASRSPTQLRLASPARTHDTNRNRNPISRLGEQEALIPPTSDMCVYIYIYILEFACAHPRTEKKGGSGVRWQRS